MNKIQKLMLKHPYISIAIIMPFALALVLGVFSSSCGKYLLDTSQRAQTDLPLRIGS